MAERNIKQGGAQLDSMVNRIIKLTAQGHEEDKTNSLTLEVKGLVDQNERRTLYRVRDVYSSNYGYLSEFNPQYKMEEDLALERRPNTQVLGLNLNREDTKEGKLVWEISKYIKPYRAYKASLRNFKLIEESRDAKAEDSGAAHSPGNPYEDAPFFEIINPIVDYENNYVSTLYLWTRNDINFTQTFREFIDDVKETPATNPERTLKQTVSIMGEMIAWAKRFYENDRLYLNLSPMNFSVNVHRARGEGPRASVGSANIVEVNLINIEFLAKDEGSQPKPLDLSLFTEQIGSLFLDLLNIDEESVDLENYNDIYRKVKNSDLISASLINSDVWLIYSIVTFLQRCFGINDGIEPFNGFDSVLKGLGDIENNITSSKKVKVSEDDKRELAVKVFTSLLSQKKNKAKEKTRVMIFGLGNNGQGILDTLLQVAQTANKRLSVKVLCHDVSAHMDMYLKARPALMRLVRIYNNSSDNPKKDLSYLEPEEEDYGQLEFEEMPRDLLSKEDAVKLRDVDTITDRYTSVFLNNDWDDVDYIFISLGDDKINEAFAEGLRKYCEVMFGEDSVAVKYILKDFFVENPLSGSFIDEDDEDSIIINYREDIDPMMELLNRMAFNIHLIWNNTPNSVDMAQFYDEFINNEKDHTTCLLSALAILSGLRNKGYDLTKAFEQENTKPSDSENPKPNLLIQEENREERVKQAVWGIAHRFNSEIVRANNIEAIDELAYLEHRSWLLGKACDGWEAPIKAGTHGKSVDDIDFDKFINITLQNLKSDRLHPRMFRSSRENNLRELSHSDWKLSWDSEALQGLDPLETMNVKSHQEYEALWEARRNAPPKTMDLSIIRMKIAKESEETQKAFDNLVMCLLNSSNGSQRYSKKFQRFLRVFLQSIKSPELREDIAKRLEQIEEFYWPMIEMNLYTNFKEKYESLIRNIPFILTNVRDKSIVMPFNMRNGTDELFKNVASVSAFNPYRVTYLVILNYEEELDEFLDKLRKVIDYYNTRESGVAVNISALLTGRGFNDENKREDARKRLTELSDAFGRIESVVVNHTESKLRHTALEIFKDELSRLKRGGELTHVDLSACMFGFKPDLQRQFEEMVLSEDYPSFKFDAPSMSILSSYKCDELSYVDLSNTYITAQELMTLSDEEYKDSFESLVPAFDKSEVSDIWSIYKGDKKDYNYSKMRAWHYLCELQKENSKQYPDGWVNLKIHPEKKVKTPEFKREGNALSVEVLGSDYNFTKSFFDKGPVEREDQNKPKRRIASPTPITSDLDNRFRDKYFAPYLAFPAAERIVDRLVEDGFVEGTESNVNSYTPTTIQLKFKTKKAHENNPTLSQMNLLLKRPLHLATNNLLEDYHFSENGEDYLGFHYIDLHSHPIYKRKKFFRDRHLVQEEAKQIDEEINKSLESLYKKNIITNVFPPEPKELKDKIFYFSSLRSKRLLTDPKIIFMLWAYHNALQTGYFDDITCIYSNKVVNKYNKEDHELQLILTKGFNTFILAYNDLERHANARYEEEEKQFLDNLSFVMEQVSANARPIIAVRPQEEDFKSGPSMKIFKEVEFICSDEDITNIGKVLVDFAEKSIKKEQQLYSEKKAAEGKSKQMMNASVVFIP